MTGPLPHVSYRLAGAALVPNSIELLGDGPKLNDQVCRKFLRLGLAALLPPQANEVVFVIAHDHAGI
jgi:hypothetical protein